ncbi:recombinase family protein [Streptomyces sp. CB02923]|uniref:recombinase family protein n=1 Tax=Streptomyces sp. CB02923 TaxID=1718985 RepID=UPI001F5B1727|nr:recombinase family protein [Streptomyces sp. CB02923]
MSKHGTPRDKIFTEKISTRVRVRPNFEEALRTARKVKAHAPHCRVIFTVYEMKRLGRDAAELPVLADHLTAHGLVLEMLAGPLPDLFIPTGKRKGQNPSVASIYRALAEHAKREAYPEAVAQAHDDFAALTGSEVPEPRTEAKALTTR